jgi:hypothetical protein
LEEANLYSSELTYEHLRKFAIVKGAYNIEVNSPSASVKWEAFKAVGEHSSRHFTAI